MQKRAFLLKHVTLALLALLVARACCASALPHQIGQQTPSRDTLLRFGQTLALADLDGDDRIDRAMLGGTGHSKSLDIRFSHTTTHTLLRFDTLTSDRGSVFASDIDNDGDNDLVWTDLIHPDDVVIWLADGTGRFERVCPDRFASAFVLTGAPVYDGPENPQMDSASGPQRLPWPSLLPASKILPSIATPIIFTNGHHARFAEGCQQACLNRGPPSLLS
jgi:hypothetical protein